MIALTTAYRLPGEMSAEFSAFRRQLPGGGYGAPHDALGPVSALTEIQEALDDPEQIKGDNLVSLKRDVGLALAGLGPKTAALCQREVEALIGELPEAGPAAKKLRASTATTEALSDRFSEGAVRGAAFSDAAAAFMDRETRTEVCELRLLQLRELVEHVEIDWKYLCGRLKPVLEDRREVIAAEVPSAAREDGEIAGADEDLRLEICARRVAEPPRFRDAAVWLVIDHEALPEPWIDLGPIQVFAGELWPDGLAPGGRLSAIDSRYSPPPELTDLTEPQIRSQRIDLGKVLVARVWVSQAPIGGAIARARLILESLIEVANPESSWRLYDGALAWNPAGTWYGSSFVSPAESDRLARPVHPVFERTAEYLQELDLDVVERLAAQEEDARAAMRQTRIDLAVTGQQRPELRLALGTRAIERMLGGDAGYWADSAGELLLAPWVENALYWEILEAAHSGLEALKFWGLGGTEEYKELRARLWLPEGPGRHVFSLKGFAECAESMLALMDDPGTTAHRLVVESASYLSDPAAALDRVETLEGRFFRLLPRAKRQRNSLIHGGGSPPAAMQGVDSFLRQLAAYALRDALNLGTPASPVARLEVEKADYYMGKHALSQGARLSDSLLAKRG